MGVSGGVADEIKAIENRNAECAKGLADLEATVASERATLLADLKIAKETMTLEKTEADKVALKGEIACVGEEVAHLDKAATRVLREKHEMWQSVSFNKQCRWMHERFLASVASE